MTPDIEELIKKVNTLTLDKNRLRQKLAQLSQTSTNQSVNNNNNISRDVNSSLVNNNSSSPSSITNSSTANQQQHFHFHSTPNSLDDNEKGGSNTNSDANKQTSSPKNKPPSDSSIVKCSSTSIGGVECSTSCEDDLLFMNELYRTRLDEYNENWDYIQSKCTALLSELKALQEHYAGLKKEKLDLQEKYDAKCEECEQIKAELQTVVVNYETQLSAMSEHLSLITSQVSLADSLGRVHQASNPSSN